MTVVFPAFCPACGLIFESRLIAIEGQGRVEGLTLKGNREPCPNCGEEAQTLEGTFDVVDDTIEVLSASGLTWEALERVSAILEQARAGEMSTDAAVEAVTNEAPSFKPLLDRYGPRMRKAFILFLLTVIQILIAQGLSELRDDSATKQDVKQAVEQAVAECKRQSP
jgi:hypothetical protein